MSGEARTTRVLWASALLRGLVLGSLLGLVAPWASSHGPALHLLLGAGTLLGAGVASLLSRRLGRRQVVVLALISSAAGAIVLAVFSGSGAAVLPGGLLIVWLPLEVPATAWMRESVVAHRQGSAVGTLVAFSGVGFITGLLSTFLCGTGGRPIGWSLLALGLAAGAGAVARVRTDPPASMGLSPALTFARVAGWFRVAPDGFQPVRGVMLGLSFVLAAAFLLSVRPISPGLGERVVTAASALTAILVAARAFAGGKHPRRVVALLAILLGLVLGWGFQGDAGVLVPPWAPALGLGLWIVGVGLCVVFGPTHLLLALPEEHRSDLFTAWGLLLGLALALAGVLGLLAGAPGPGVVEEGLMITDGYAAALAAIGLAIWGWTSRPDCC